MLTQAMFACSQDANGLNQSTYCRDENEPIVYSHRLQMHSHEDLGRNSHDGVDEEDRAGDDNP